MISKTHNVIIFSLFLVLSTIILYFRLNPYYTIAYNTFIIVIGLYVNNIINKYEKMISIDQFTGVYNKKHFDNTLRVKNTNETVYLLYIDVDNFSRINNDYGHEFGDKILLNIVETIRKNIRYDDDLFRVGGDEFAVLVKNKEEVIVYKTAERIRKAIEFTDFIMNINITVSIGITKSDKHHDLTNLYKNADAAMFISKKSGKNTISFS